MLLLQPLHDCERLGEQQAVHLQRWHQCLRVLGAVAPSVLLAARAHQAHRGRGIEHAIQVQRDAPLRSVSRSRV
jgi:hypothetical protein